MLKNDILEQLTDLFNLSFTTSTFPTLLKTAKVIPILGVGDMVLILEWSPDIALRFFVLKIITQQYRF